MTTTTHLGIQIDPTRDSLISEEGRDMLRKFYLLPHEDSIQKAYARAANCFSFGNHALAQRIYDYVSLKWFMYASPVLSNAIEIDWSTVPQNYWAPYKSKDLAEWVEINIKQRARGLPISCFLTFVPDHLRGLIDHTEEERWMSVFGGGVGGHWSSVRSVSDKAPGPIPFLKTIDADMTAYMQGRTRKGSYAAYLSVDHPDIREFIQMRKPSGGDPNRKCLNLHNGVNITDAFLDAVRSDSFYNLIDPNDKTVRETVRAREIWELILDTRQKTGEPYLFYIDEANRQLPQHLKDLGHKINGSNLCFSGDTIVAVADGRNGITIKELAAESNGIKKFPVYSARKRTYKNQFGHSSTGNAWVPEIKWAVAFKTGTQKLIKVTLDDGSSFRCTEDHEIALKDGGYEKAKNLVPGTSLEPFNSYTPHSGQSKYRNICSKTNGSKKQHRMIYEFFNGKIGEVGFHVDHIVSGGTDSIENLQLLKREDHYKKTAEEFKGANNPVHRIRDVDGWLEKKSISSTLDRNPRFGGHSNEDLINIGRKLIKEHGKLTTTIWEDYKKNFDPTIPLSFSKNRFGGKWSNFMSCVVGNHKVASVEFTDDFEDVYDLTVEDNHNFYIITSTQDDKFLNSSGVLVHNCTEITLPTSEDRSAVCCLSSVNAEFFDSWKDSTMIEDLVEFLDNVLEFFILAAPPTLRKAVNSASNERSIGIGLMGFHSYLQSKNVPFEGVAAMSINRHLFSVLKKKAVAASQALATIRGACPDSEAGNSAIPIRNSHLIAPAPNASSSISAGCSPATEPWSSNAMVRKTRSGDAFVLNEYLRRLIIKHAELNNLDQLWIDEQIRSVVSHEGSVLHLDWMTDFQKDVFKTAFEIDQMWTIEHARIRQPFIDQAQSVNLFFGAVVTKKYVNRCHLAAFAPPDERGGVPLKSLYYFRTKPLKKGENLSEIIERVALKEAQEDNNSSNVDECLSCHG